MSAHCDLLRELVARFNQRQPIEVSRYFAENFRLDQPGGADRVGLAGAQEIIDALYALGDCVRLEILTLVEQGQYVAVRWQVEGMRGGVASAMMAMYRFEGGRIADDWGLAVGAPWRNAALD